MGDIERGYVCPNGHEFDSPVGMRCEHEGCDGWVVLVTASEALRLHEHLTRAEATLRGVRLYAEEMARDDEVRSCGADLLGIIEEADRDH